MKILQIQVVTGQGADKISITIEGPPNYPAVDIGCYLRADVVAGTAVEWIRSIFGSDIPIQVIDTKTGEVTTRVQFKPKSLSEAEAQQGWKIEIINGAAVKVLESERLKRILGKE